MAKNNNPAGRKNFKGHNSDHNQPIPTGSRQKLTEIRKVDGGWNVWCKKERKFLLKNPVSWAAAGTLSWRHKH